MSGRERHAPYAGRKLKKPEYEPIPEIRQRNVEGDTSTPEQVDVVPTRGGIAQPEKKDLPITSLGGRHEYVDTFRGGDKKVRPVIHGRTSPPMATEKPETVSMPTERSLEGITQSSPDKWVMIVESTHPDIHADLSERGTGYKLIPKERHDGEPEKT